MPKITQILQGFSMGTSQGNLAFCGVSLIEGSSASWSTWRTRTHARCSLRSWRSAV